MISRTVTVLLLALILFAPPAAAATSDFLSALIDDYDVIAVVDPSELRDEKARSALMDLIETLASTGAEMDWNLVLRVLAEYGEGEWVLGHNFIEEGEDQVGFAIARTNADEATIREYIAEVRPTLEGAGVSPDAPLYIRVKDGNLIARGQIAKVYREEDVAAVKEQDPVSVAKLVQLREQTKGDIAFVYMKPEPIRELLLPDSAQGFGLEDLEAVAIGVSANEDGNEKVHAVLEGNLNQGLLGVLFSPARSLESLGWADMQTDLFLALSINGPQLATYLETSFEEDPEVLQDFYVALEEMVGIPVEELLATMSPEQALALRNLDQFGPASMAWNNIDLIQRAGVLTVRSNTDQIQQAFIEFCKVFFEAPVRQTVISDKPVTALTLVEVDDFPLFQAFTLRQEDWTLVAMNEAPLSKAMSALGTPGDWSRSESVRKAFGGPPPETSGLLYLDLPANLAWPFLRSVWADEQDAVDTPESFANAWGPMGVRVSREENAIRIEGSGGQVFNWLEPVLEDYNAALEAEEVGVAADAE